MVQIKLSMAFKFVLAAAAIALVVAQPIREGREFTGHVGHRRHHHHHHHHHPVASPERWPEPSPDITSPLATPSASEYLDKLEALFHGHCGHDGHHHHHHFEAPAPQDPSSQADPNAPPSSRREYVDESEICGLLFGQNNIPYSLERQDAQLEHKHQFLKSEDRHLEHKDRRLERQDRKLEHKHHFLEGKKHRQHKHLERKRKRKSLTAQEKSLEGKHSSLKHQNKALGKKDKKLALKGKVLAHEDKVIAQKGKALAHHDKVLEQKSKVLLGHGPVVHSKSETVARKYAESNNVFEWDSEDVESCANTLPHFKSPSHLGDGLVVLHPRHESGVSKRPRGGNGKLMFTNKACSPPWSRSPNTC